MKWIGQHIYDQVSRFRNHTYFEDSVTLSTGKSITMDEYTSGTISITKIQDSGTTFNDNDTSLMTAAAIADKIEAYGYSTASGDITGVDLTGTTGIDITSETNTTSGNYSATIGVDVSDFMTNGSDNRILTATGADAMNAEANLSYDGDDLTATSSTSGKPIITIKNTTDDTAGSFLKFVKDKGGAGADGDDIGTIEFISDNTEQQQTSFAKILVEVSESLDTDEAGKLTLFVAASDGSTSELKPGLILEGEHATDSEVDVTIANGAASTTTIAGTLTIGSTSFANNSGVVQVATQGTIDHDSLANFVANEHIDWTASSAGTVHSTNIPTLNQNTTGTAATVTGAAQTNITSLGTLTALAVTGDVTVTGDNVTFQSANADDPLVTIKNTSNAANDMARLNMVKERNGGTAASGDNVAEVRFMSKDASGNEQQYGLILGEIDVATHGQESGIMKLGVANHDGGSGYGLTLTGGSVNDEVDTTIGLGTASVTTVAGDLSVTSNATISGTLTATTRKFTKTGNTDGSYDGDIVCFGDTEELTIGAIYHYKSDGTWEAADADAAANCDGLLAVALSEESNSGMLIRGMVTLDHDPGAVGDVLFLSTTAGDCSATAPSGTGDIIRVVGYCLDASNGQIWFDPDKTYVEVA